MRKPKLNPNKYVKCIDCKYIKPNMEHISWKGKPLLGNCEHSEFQQLLEEVKECKQFTRK